MKSSDFPPLPPVKIGDPISMENAKWDMSAFGAEAVLTLTCVGCKIQSKFGATLEGVTRLYFNSRWTLLNRNALMGSASEVDALCETCLKKYVDTLKETPEMTPNGAG